MRGSISIHALTRSATAPFSSPKTCQTISIHALTRSATHLGIKGYGYEINFNPRTHKECDLFVDGVAGVGDSISIHALTRSATKDTNAVNGSTTDISIHALTRSATTVVFISASIC